jgi:hypothetical protein
MKYNLSDLGIKYFKEARILYRDTPSQHASEIVMKIKEQDEKNDSNNDGNVEDVTGEEKITQITNELERSITSISNDKIKAPLKSALQKIFAEKAALIKPIEKQTDQELQELVNEFIQNLTNLKERVIKRLIETVDLLMLRQNQHIVEEAITKFQEYEKRSGDWQKINAFIFEKFFGIKLNNYKLLKAFGHRFQTALGFKSTDGKIGPRTLNNSIQKLGIINVKNVKFINKKSL